jgi:Flp pilus assembly pilin Flp
LKGVEIMGRLKNFKEFMREDDGMGTVEIILIIVVLVGLVIIFKGRITTIVENLFDKITTQTDSV